MATKPRTACKAAGFVFPEAIRPWLARVEERISESLTAEDKLIEDVSTHLLRAGGKRLRPALVLLSGMACREKADLEPLVPVAAAAELIHMATLVHDDAVDQSFVRRGGPTVNARWGDNVAILMGDYLFARAFALLAATGKNKNVGVMAEVVFEMSLGEIQQLAQAYDAEQTEDAYIKRINRKTALLFAASCRLGAYLSGAPPEQEEALGRFGSLIGCGFQIIDDILDLTSEEDRLGKPIGSDLRSGVVTLPVIHALNRSGQRELIATHIRDRKLGEKEITDIRALVEECGGIEYARDGAERLTRQAREQLAQLPASLARDALESLADILLRRDY